MRLSVSVWSLAALVALVLHIFIATTVYAPLFPLGADGINYEEHAVRLLATGNLLDPLFLKPTSYWPPLWPMILAGVYYVFGHTLFVVRVFESLLLVAASFCTYLLGRHLFDECTGLVASLLIAYSPTLFVFTTLHNLEVVFTALVVGSVLCWILSRQAASPRRQVFLLALAGVLWGLSILTKPVPLAFLPFMLVWEIIQDPQRLRRAIARMALYTTVGFLIILPWTMRNYVVFHEFILVNTNGGIDFELGNNPIATGGFGAAPNWDELGLANAGSLARGLTFVRDNPERYLRLLATKFSDFWSEEFIFLNGSADDVITFAPLSEFGHGWFSEHRGAINLFSTLVFGLGMGLSLLSSGAAMRRRLALYVPIACFVLAALLFFGEPRYRIPVYPFTAILQAFALVAVFRFLAGLKTRIGMKQVAA